MKKSNFLLLLILVLAALLRFYQLGNNPPSLDWDEASLGYNAYSLLKTGKDEFGRFLPISIRSFEDYKPAVYSYLTTLSIFFFGLTDFSVRLPSAVFGVLTVLFTYFLVMELLNWGNQGTKRDNREMTALLSAMLLTISPWHLQFSRVAFEANVALFMVVAGLYFFLRARVNPGWYAISAILLVLSFYTYHSPRLVVPLILVGWIFWQKKPIGQQKKWFVATGLLSLILLLPFFIEALGVGRARLASVTALNPDELLASSIKRLEYDQQRGDWFGQMLHNRRIMYLITLAKGYLDHFNLDFLFLRGDAPARHHVQDMGMLYLWEAPFVLTGMLYLLKRPQGKYVFWWFLVSPAASAFTTGTPHAVRALIMLPTYQIFTALGLTRVWLWLDSKTNVSRVPKIGIIGIIGVSLCYYLNQYYIHTPIEVSRDWQYGYKQMVAEVAKYESDVDKIIITYAYDQPHVYVLFYNQIDPVWYQSQLSGGEVERFNRRFGKYEFRHIDWSQDKQKLNTLLVGTASEIPDTASGKTAEIKFLDGSVAFRIVKS